MKMDKEYYKKMHSFNGMSYAEFNLYMAISRSKGKDTSVIVCPKKAKIKPFLIFNN